MSYSDEEIEAMFNEADKNGDGSIDFAEFVTVFEGDNISDDELHTTFSQFDSDGDGAITFEEFKQAIYEIKK